MWHLLVSEILFHEQAFLLIDWLSYPRDRTYIHQSGLDQVPSVCYKHDTMCYHIILSIRLGMRGRCMIYRHRVTWYLYINKMMIVFQYIEVSWHTHARAHARTLAHARASHVTYGVDLLNYKKELFVSLQTVNIMRTQNRYLKICIYWKLPIYLMYSVWNFGTSSQIIHLTSKLFSIYVPIQ